MEELLDKMDEILELETKTHNFTRKLKNMNIE